MPEEKAPRNSPLASTVSGRYAEARLAQVAPPRISQRSGVAGLAVGSLVSVLVQPLDVIRTRIQADAASRVASATWHTSKAIYGEHGLRYDPVQCPSKHIHTTRV